MFNTKLNNGYQSINDPSMNMNENGYQIIQQDPYAVYNPQDQYAMQGQDGSMMPDIPYPTPPAETNTAFPQGYNLEGFAKGGKVKKKKGRSQNNPYPSLAELVRQQGNGKDTILAHINPLEAAILKSIGGSGTINKKTGLPQFGFFSNPLKAMKGAMGGGLGAVVGNMILPGVGGLIGGALGGAAGSAVRGRKDYGQAALRGLGIGALAPTVAGLAGSGLSSLGVTGAGGALTKYGNENAILPALGKIFGGGGGSETLGGIAGQASAPANLLAASISPSNLSAAGGQAVSAAASAGGGGISGMGFADKLLGNSSKFLSDPKNLLTAGVLASSMFNRPKKEKAKTPEQIANEQKRLEKALMLSPEERSAKQNELIAEARMHRSVARNKFLPEERLGNLDPLYRRSHTPEEQKLYGKWFGYYNNPDFSGEPLPFKEGGLVEDSMDIGAPTQSFYVDGIGGGQDDNLRVGLPDNSYIVDASTVADLGDGNSRAGADKIDALISNGEYYISPEDVARFGKLGAQKLNSFVKNVRKHKGGTVKLPPKAKPLSSYLK